MLRCWEVMDAGDPTLGGGYQEGKFSLVSGDISAPQRPFTMEDTPPPQRGKRENSCTKALPFSRCHHSRSTPPPPPKKKKGGRVGVGGESRLGGRDWIVGRGPEGLMPL